MARLMRDPAFRQQQRDGVRAPHVAPVNALVDELRGQGLGSVPYVAPWHGGSGARILSVLRDPGPMAAGEAGSGFLCIENDDATAERQASAFAQVGIAPADLTPWNAYPWYVNRAPSAGELDLGVPPLVHLVALMPRLRVVLLQGKHAQDSWRRLRLRHPDLERERALTVIATYHPGRQALFARDPAVRLMRQQHRDDSCRQAALALATT